MKKSIIPFVILYMLVAPACQDGGNKAGNEAMTTDTVVTGLEGSRDQPGQLLTDVKPDTTSGQSEKVNPLGQRVDSINARGSASSAEQQFVTDAVNANTEEIGMGKLARKQSTNADVKKIASELEKDHTAALKELNSLSRKKKLGTGSTPLAAGNEMSNMKALKGAAFDKAWCSMMIEKHKTTISRYENGQNTLSDADLKGWINKNLPKLRMHNDHLMAIHDKL